MAVAYHVERRRERESTESPGDSSILSAPLRITKVIVCIHMQIQYTELA